MQNLINNFSLFIFLLSVAGLIVLFYVVPIRLWITAIFSGVRLSLIRDLVGMRLRRVPPGDIVRQLITAHKAGIFVNTSLLEAHYLAGGNVSQVVSALISADKANINLNFEQATAIDLAGRNVFEAVQLSGQPEGHRHAAHFGHRERRYSAACHRAGNGTGQH